MEIVHISPNGDYTQYEELTLQKEELEKEAEIYQTIYLKEFGELITKVFELKVDCIALKKEIALYVAAKNSGKPITAQEVEEYLKTHMTAYHKQLDSMLKEKENAKKAKAISSVTVSQVKKIYRRLAKMLHPDISPLTVTFPQLYTLFNRVIIAYRCNDLKELQKLEVLVKKELEQNGIDNFNMVVPNITERICELEQDIDTIVKTNPYNYKKLLKDEEAIEKKKDELNTEINEYINYKKDLVEKVTQLKEESKNG